MYWYLENKTRDISVYTKKPIQNFMEKSNDLKGFKMAKFINWYWFKHILFDQSQLHKYNIIEVGSDNKP